MTTPHLLSQVGGIIGVADYFDEYLGNIPSELQYRQTNLDPDSKREMLAYLLKSPWLDGIQKDIEEKSNRFIPKDELLNEMMENTDYDYGGAYLARGTEIFMKEGGYTPDTPFASPHPSLTRDQAAQILMRKKF